MSEVLIKDNEDKKQFLEVCTSAQVGNENPG